MDAKEKERQLYTNPNWESLIANIMVGESLWICCSKAAKSSQVAPRLGLDLDAHDLRRFYFDILGLALGAAHGLVDHDPAVRQR